MNDIVQQAGNGSLCVCTIINATFKFIYSLTTLFLTCRYLGPTEQQEETDAVLWLEPSARAGCQNLPKWVQAYKYKYIYTTINRRDFGFPPHSGAAEISDFRDVMLSHWYSAS